MSTHTPGPWWIEDCRLTHPQTGSRSGGGGLLIQGAHCGPNSSRNVATVNSYPHSEVEGDARLIAAAPDLLYVAKLVTEVSDILGENNMVVQLARAAVAKAAAP